MKTSFNRQRYTPSSELVRVNQEKARNHNRLKAYYKGNVDGDTCESYPDYNAWVKALDGDPDYIKKVEKQLDRELGEDRLF